MTPDEKRDALVETCARTDCSKTEICPLFGFDLCADFDELPSFIINYLYEKAVKREVIKGG